MDPMGLTPLFLREFPLPLLMTGGFFLKRNSESGMHIPEAKTAKWEQWEGRKKPLGRNRF